MTGAEAAPVDRARTAQPVDPEIRMSLATFVPASRAEKVAGAFERLVVELATEGLWVSMSIHSVDQEEQP